MKKVIFIAGLLLANNVFSVDEYDFYMNYEETEKEFISYIENSQIGKRAVWIEQRSDSAYEEWQKVVLVFGWLDDYSECKKIVNFFEQTDDGLEFRCNIIN